LHDAYCQNVYTFILHIFYNVSLQSGDSVVVSSNKTSDAKSAHVLDFMLEEPSSAAEEDLPAGPKRCGIIFIVAYYTRVSAPA